MSGKLMMISGIDGSGKSTVATYLRKILFSNGVNKIENVDAMKGGAFSTQMKQMAADQECSLRQYASPDLLNLMWTADLIDNYRSVVVPKLEENRWVIMHRSDLCCRVYSRLFSPGNDFPDYVLDHFSIVPDLHIHVEITPETAYERICKRNRVSPTTEKESLRYLIEADALYHQYLEKEQYQRVITIKNQANEHELLLQVKKAVDSWIMHENAESFSKPLTVFS